MHTYLAPQPTLISHNDFAEIILILSVPGKNFLGLHIVPIASGLFKLMSETLIHYVSSDF